MRRSSLISSLAAASMGVSLGSGIIASPGPSNSTGSGRRSYFRHMIGEPANINRHTGKPHEHRREMARRVRQMGGRGQ